MANAPGTLVVICGETGAGKTTAACSIRNNCRAYTAATRDPLVRYAEKHGYPTDRRTLQRIWSKLRDRHGDDVIWQRLLKQLQDCQEPIIIIEGLRRVVDLQRVTELAESLGRELLIVFLYVGDDMPGSGSAERKRRVNKRRQAEGKEPLTDEEWRALEADETASQLPRVQAAVMEDEDSIVIDTAATPADKVGERIINALPAALTDPVD